MTRFRELLECFRDDWVVFHGLVMYKNEDTCQLMLEDLEVNLRPLPGEHVWIRVPPPVFERVLQSGLGFRLKGYGYVSLYRRSATAGYSVDLGITRLNELKFQGRGSSDPYQTVLDRQFIGMPSRLKVDEIESLLQELKQRSKQRKRDYCQYLQAQINARKSVIEASLEACSPEQRAKANETRAAIADKIARGIIPKAQEIDLLGELMQVDYVLQ